MRINTIIFHVLMLLFFKVSCFLDQNIIESYFKQQYIDYGAIFSCSIDIEQISLIKLIQRNYHISYTTIVKNGRNWQRMSKNKIGMILDGDCSNIEQFLIECSSNNLFKHNYHWLIMATADITKKFEHVDLDVNSNILMTILDNSNSATIFEVYNVASTRGGFLQCTPIGFYNVQSGFQIDKNQSRSMLRRNFTGITLKTVVTLPEPFDGTLEDYLNSDEKPEINALNRFQSRLMQFCRNYYNFSMNITLTLSWGYTYPNGSFDGMVGELEHKRADFGSSAILVNENRRKVIDYGRGTWIWKTIFMFRSPKAHVSHQIFLKPFSLIIWIHMLALFAVFIVIFKLVTFYEKWKDQREEIEASWSLSMVFILGAFCQQGFPTTPKVTCGRIAVLSVFFLTFTIYQLYSGSLVSHFLTAPVAIINSIKDLIASSLDVGCEDVLYNTDYFKHTTDVDALELYHKKILGNKNRSSFLPPGQGLELVKKGGYAFQVEAAVAYPIIATTFPDGVICELDELTMFKTQLLYTTYQKASPFQNMLDICLQQIAEVGILSRERRFWHSPKPVCIYASKSVSYSVDLEDFSAVLMLLVIGFATSFIVLVLEKMWHVLNNLAVNEDDDVIRPFVM